MSDMELLNIPGARRFFLEDEKIKIYLRTFGLYSNELYSYLKVNGKDLKPGVQLSDIFHEKADSDLIAIELGGYSFSLKKGSGKRIGRRNYPGARIFCHDYILRVFGGCFGYVRTVYEILDSSFIPKSHRLVLLRRMVNGEKIVTSEYREQMKKLIELRLLLNDRGKLVPTKMAQTIFSENVECLWEDHKIWSYRTDVFI